MYQQGVFVQVTVVEFLNRITPGVDTEIATTFQVGGVRARAIPQYKQQKEHYISCHGF
jgi:hypothetical protein